jgi:hypothetical protein
VLDSKDSTGEGHGRLYFDLNHNGDLTDDRVIEGDPAEGDFPKGYWWYQFPRVDLTLDVDGTKVEYAFFLSAYSQTVTSGASEPTGLVAASLQVAACREGRITLAGKTRHVVLLDFNSNGRFDDVVTVRTSSRGRATPVYGDLLLLDPTRLGPDDTTALPLTYDGLTQPSAAISSSVSLRRSTSARPSVMPSMSASIAIPRA